VNCFHFHFGLILLLNPVSDAKVICKMKKFI